MFEEPIIRHSYQFPNVPSHKWHSWKVDDDGSSILSGLVVKLYHRNLLIYCAMVLLVASRQVIMMIFHRSRHNDTRFICVLLG